MDKLTRLKIFEDHINLQKERIAELRKFESGKSRKKPKGKFNLRAELHELVNLLKSYDEFIKENNLEGHVNAEAEQRQKEIEKIKTENRKKEDDGLGDKIEKFIED